MVKIPAVVLNQFKALRDALWCCHKAIMVLPLWAGSDMIIRKVKRLSTVMYKRMSRYNRDLVLLGCGAVRRNRGHPLSSSTVCRRFS